MANAEAPVSTQENPRLEGIGGWLFLPLLQLVVGPLYACFEAAKAFRHAATIPDFTGPGFHETVRGIAFVLFALMIGFLTVALIVFGLFCLVKFLRKSHATPHLMIIWYGASIALTALVAIQMAIDPDLFEKTVAPDVGFGMELFRLAAKGVVSGILISYFETSVRVKNTFVR